MTRRKSRKRTDRRRTVLGILVLVLALLLAISLVFHNEADDARITGQGDQNPNPFEVNYHNQGGMMGAYLGFITNELIGWMSYFIPFWLILAALRLLSSSFGKRFELNSVLLFAIGLLSTTLYNLHAVVPGLPTQPESVIGGWVGGQLALLSLRLLGNVGSYVVLAGLIFLLLTLYWSVTPLLYLHVSFPGAGLFQKAYQAVKGMLVALITFRWLRWLVGRSSEKEQSAEEVDTEAEVAERFERTLDRALLDQQPAAGRTESDETGRPRRSAKLVKPAEPLQVQNVKYNYPTLELLRENPTAGAAVGEEELEFTARMLRETLQTFGVGVDGEISRRPGPVITRYEFKPAAGIKVNQVVGLSDDLALALKAQRIRIIAPIPGKAAVGVEIPNRKAQPVYLREIIGAEAFTSPDLILPMALGKTTSGHPFVTDLTAMPHLLIAGATGSGKSVCMNVLITSLLYRLHPMQVRFILIDPKMLELSVYQGIPHLGRPVVTKPRRAESVLADAVVEMESRYRRLAEASVRSIADYNKKQKSDEDKLPYIVICVDELADLMMSATSSKTELLITRLAQMSRAVGIHLILATQRPSVDVITGLIKANFPARLAFQVSSKVDSRTIIDANGAEKLLGKGDMLFLPSGQPEPVRLHGAYISSEETEGIVKFINDQGLQMFKLEAISQGTGEPTENDVDFGDPLFREACEVVVRHKQGSVSLLQRRLGIGYQRAARLIDRLEQAGIVSPFDGSKAREVMVDKAYLETLFSKPGAVPVAPTTDEN